MRDAVNHSIEILKKQKCKYKESIIISKLSVQLQICMEARLLVELDGTDILSSINKLEGV
jgi:hypothetical protein